MYDLLDPGGALLLIQHETIHGLEPITPAPAVQPPHPPVPHGAIRDVVARYLPQGAAAPDPKPERHDVLLGRTRFGRPERLLLPGRVDLVRTVDQVIDAYLGTAFASPDRFGDRLAAFRAEVSDVLKRHTDTSAFWWWPGDTEVLMARKRS